MSRRLSGPSTHSSGPSVRRANETGRYSVGSQQRIFPGEDGVKGVDSCLPSEREVVERRGVGGEVGRGEMTANKVGM